VVLNDEDGINMSQRVRRSIPELKRLRRIRDKKKFLETCSQDVIDSICECSKNVLKGNVPLSTAAFKKLRHHKTILRKLSDRKVPAKTRRKLLQQQSGGFLGALLGPLIGLASSMFSGLLNRDK
jgi:hypothetical protein